MPPQDSRPTLDALGLQFGTDKASDRHGYLEIYEEFFHGLRDAPLTLLEIGVLNGASLATWEAYFPNAQIIGADINPRVASLAQGRVKIEIIDQSNIQDLVDLAVAHGPFDIVVEDGSHMWEHQVTTLRTLFPFVKDRGFYVVEDLQTNYGKGAEKYRGIARASCMDYLKTLADYRVADGALDIAQEEDAFLRSYARRMRRMVFTRHACLIEKGAARPTPGAALRAAPRTGARLLGPGPIGLPLRLRAHLGGFGDTRSDAGSLLVEDPAAIHGFVIKATGEAARLLLYRVRLDTGAWTDWVPVGTFAGTRGQGGGLTGVAMKLRQPAPGLDLRLAAVFGEGQPVLAGDAEDCVPPGPPAPLRGLEVRLSGVSPA